MANLKSSKKDIIRTKRNHDRNKHLKTTLKSALKSAHTAIDAKSDDVQAIVFSTCRLVDKSTNKGIIKKNTAARKKSKLMKALHSLSSTAK